MEKDKESVNCKGSFLPLLHCTGTELWQIRGSEIAKFLLINGMDRGTFPVIIRQVQSMLSDMRDFSELQQSAVGEEPVALLLVM